MTPFKVERTLRKNIFSLDYFTKQVYYFYFRSYKDRENIHYSKTLFRKKNFPLILKSLKKFCRINSPWGSPSFTDVTFKKP